MTGFFTSIGDSVKSEIKELKELFSDPLGYTKNSYRNQFSNPLAYMDAISPYGN